MGPLEKSAPNRQLWPVLAGFFIMAFSDLVAPITPRIAASLPEHLQPLASFLPTTVFLWFLLLSVPVAGLMNRIGRRRTALLGDALVAVGLMTAYVAGDRGPGGYFAGFGLLGIGCTAIQVSVNPMLALLAPHEKMSVYLTLGQVFRNTALLLLAPIVSCLVLWTGSWRLLLPLYALLTLIAGAWMAFTRFDDPEMEHGTQAGGTGWRNYLALAKNPAVAVCSAAIGVFLMLDVGIGYLSVQLVDSPNPLMTTTGFYACRIAGSLAGVWLLSRFDDLNYLRGCMLLALLICIQLLAPHGTGAVYCSVGLLGFLLACVFSTFYAAATRAVPERANEVAGLMILMIAAGALSTPIIGALVRSTGNPHTGVWFLIPCTLYLWWAARYIKKRGA